MTRVGVALELIEHGPAVDVGKRQVQQHGAWLELTRQHHRGAPLQGHDALEPAFPRRIQENASEDRVVLDDQRALIIA
jgi:hypothetical protein